MRQIGTLTTSDDAQRFTAYLITQDIPAQADADGDGFSIWVKNEDQVLQARESLDHFRLAPQDARYQGVAARAAAKVREEQQTRLKARENVVDISRKWQVGGGARISMRQAPFTYALIGLSILVGLLTSLGDSPRSGAARYLSFSSLPSFDPVRGYVGPPITADGQIDGLYDIRHGQVWRLVTPIFLHFGIFHIVFNLIWLHALGRQLEVNIGTWRMALLVLAIAIASNLSQYLWEGNPNFGGMSGVVYGLFGYIWVKMTLFPDSTLYVSGQTVFILLAWMFLCIATEVDAASELRKLVGDVANAAHVVGLLSGMAISAVPYWLRRS